MPVHILVVFSLFKKMKMTVQKFLTLPKSVNYWEIKSTCTPKYSTLLSRIPLTQKVCECLRLTPVNTVVCPRRISSSRSCIYLNLPVTYRV